MIPIPAIDLKNGKVVRLHQGDFSKEKIYSEKAGPVAKRFETDGATRIHVVDLDGALSGAPVNFDMVEDILRNVRIPIEVGGGIRDLRLAGEYIRMGVRWVVLGTKACMDQGFMKEAIEEYRDKIIVGIDARDGLVATDGWTRLTQIRAADFAATVEQAGGRTVIYTDISKDGAMLGPNVREIDTMSNSLSIDLIASGGVSALKDIDAIRRLNRPNIAGVIIGKALYEKSFTLKDAIRQCSPNE